MSKWAYIPGINNSVLGSTIVSEENRSYQDVYVYQKFIDIPYGYIAGANTWAYVEYSLQINFIKILDLTLPEVGYVKSTGVYEGCVVTKRSATQLNISNGIAFFPQGRKQIISQNITLNAGNTEPILNIFMAFDGKITVTKDDLDNNVYLDLGLVTMSGDTILNVYSRFGSYMPGSIKQISDLLRELGPWLSGCTYSFNTANGSFSRIGGFVNGFYVDKVRVPQSSPVEITKVYKGDVLGQTFTNFTLSSLKEVSVQGGATPLTTGQIVTHYLALDPATLKTYLFISDYVRSGADNSINIQSIISDINRANKGKLFSDFCVLVGAVAVRFSATTLGNLNFVVLHENLNGARGIGAGVYPSPYDFPNGGDLVSTGTKYTIRFNYFNRIAELMNIYKSGKYLFKYDSNVPNSNIDVVEYGNTNPGVEILAMTYSRIATARNDYDVYCCNKDRSGVMRFYGQKGYPSGYGSGSAPGGISFVANGVINNYWGNVYSSYLTCIFPKLPFFLPAAGERGFDYSTRTSVVIEKDKMYILQVYNNVQPSEYSDIFSNLHNGAKTFPLKDDIVMQIKQKAQIMKDKVKQLGNIPAWSTVCLQGLGEETYNTSYMTVSIQKIAALANTLTDYFEVQPNDVLHIEDINMNLAKARNFIITTAFGGVFKPLSRDVNQPYKTEFYTTRIILVPYANLPYTGQPT